MAFRVTHQFRVYGNKTLGGTTYKCRHCPFKGRSYAEAKGHYMGEQHVVTTPAPDTTWDSITVTLRRGEDTVTLSLSKGDNLERAYRRLVALLKDCQVSGGYDERQYNQEGTEHVAVAV